MALYEPLRLLGVDAAELEGRWAEACRKAPLETMAVGWSDDAKAFRVLGL